LKAPCAHLQIEVFASHSCKAILATRSCTAKASLSSLGKTHALFIKSRALLFRGNSKGMVYF